MEDADETDGLPMATSAPSPDPDRPDRGESDRRRAPYAIKLPADTPHHRQGQDRGAERDAHPAGDEDQSRSGGHRPQAGVTGQRWWRVADIDADSPG